MFTYYLVVLILRRALNLNFRRPRVQEEQVAPPDGADDLPLAGRAHAADRPGDGPLHGLGLRRHLELHVQPGGRRLRRGAHREGAHQDLLHLRRGM